MGGGGGGGEGVLGGGGGQIRNVTIKQKSRIFDGGNQILNVTK